MFVALYKTFRGGEWLKASLDSVKESVDLIVLVHSRVEWGRGYGIKNNCLVPAAEWIRDNPDVKMIQLAGDYLNQESQYESGYQFIHNSFGDVHLLLVDSDEIWRSGDLRTLKAEMSAGAHAAYCCRMRTYVKSPFYRIFPPETCTPVVGIDMKKTRIEGPRGMFVKDKLLLEHVWMHHFTYVRAEEEDIRVKFRSSAYGDGVAGRPDWFEKVWPYIPNVHDFHPSIGYAESWRSLETVRKEDLPYAVQNHPLVNLKEILRRENV